MSVFDTALTSFIDRKLAQPYRALTETNPTAPSLAKGLLAGAIAGLAAIAAQSLAERIYPGDHTANPAGDPHWAFGAVTGAAYGALAEFYPAAANRDGVSFGMTLMALTAESAAPSSSNVNKLPLGDGNREQASRIASHVVFGVVAETTRRTVRKML